MVNIEVIYVIYLLLCATLGYFIAKHIGLKSENKKLKERVSNEKKTMYDVWLRALSNNLPMIPDNQHGKESKDEQKILLFMTKEEEYILDSIEQIIEKIKSNKKSK